VAENVGNKIDQIGKAECDHGLVARLLGLMIADCARALSMLKVS
jgi:hypothetical protein